MNNFRQLLLNKFEREMEQRKGGNADMPDIDDIDVFITMDLEDPLKLFLTYNAQFYDDVLPTVLKSEEPLKRAELFKLVVLFYNNIFKKFERNFFGNGKKKLTSLDKIYNQVRRINGMKFRKSSHLNQIKTIIDVNVKGFHILYKLFDMKRKMGNFKKEDVLKQSKEKIAFQKALKNKDVTQKEMNKLYRDFIAKDVREPMKEALFTNFQKDRRKKKGDKNIWLKFYRLYRQYAPLTLTKTGEKVPQKKIMKHAGEEYRELKKQGYKGEELITMFRKKAYIVGKGIIRG